MRRCRCNGRFLLASCTLCRSVRWNLAAMPAGLGGMVPEVSVPTSKYPLVSFVSIMRIDTRLTIESGITGGAGMGRWAIGTKGTSLAT
jgi:hypothetical protein